MIVLLAMTIIRTAIAQGLPSNVEIVVSGMDALHAQAARDGAVSFAALLSRFAGTPCTAVSASSYKVRVAYDPSLGQVLGVIRTDLSIPPALPYQANTRIVNLACSGVVAGAACRTWGLRQVVIQHEMVKGGMLAEYDCHSPSEPYGLLVQPTSQGTCDVGMIESSMVSGIVEPRGTLPDGSSNCTERLVSIIGEASWDAPTRAISDNEGGNAVSPAPTSSQEHVATDEVVSGMTGVEKAPLVGGVLGGVGSVHFCTSGGALGQDVGEVRIFHHSELEPKKRVYPEYPEAAKEANLGDYRCLATVCIDEEGIPYDVMVENCPPMFAQPTKETMMMWRWYPPKEGKNAVKAQTTIAVAYLMK